jgi:hypothetical protein
MEPTRHTHKQGSNGATKGYIKVNPKIRQVPITTIITYLKFHKTPISDSPTINSTKYYIKSRNTGITQISLNDQKYE